MNLTAQESPSQSLDIQLLKEKTPVLRYQRVGGLVVKVLSPVAHLRVDALQCVNSFPPAGASSFSSRYFSMCSAQPRQRLFQVAWILNSRAVAQSSEDFQTDINTPGLITVGQRRRRALYTKTDVPPSCIAFHCDSFDLSDNRAMQFDLHAPNTLQPHSSSVQQLAPIAVAREGHTLVSAAGLESRIACFLPMRHTAKEGSERLVYPPQNILTCREVREAKTAVHPCLFQLSGLGVVVQRDACLTIGIAPFLQGGIVQTTGFFDLFSQGTRLSLRRIQAVEIGPSHLFALLAFNVVPHGFLTDRAHGGAKVTTAPESRCGLLD